MRTELLRFIGAVERPQITYLSDLLWLLDKLFGFLRRNAKRINLPRKSSPAVYLSPFQKLFNRLPMSLTVIAGRKGNRMHSILNELGRRKSVGHALRTTQGANRAVQEPELFGDGGREVDSVRILISPHFLFSLFLILFSISGVYWSY